ncbi:MAG: hypothetical protein GF317_21070 [Candidatus Lokiarchaeota archaeon]|nr:hypothetical protein [Candidatus Lokiarchaeota archaeon]MBD3201937.1 hypothetical protein [Candidatus Lokiarchaeota archaeon]
MTEFEDKVLELLGTINEKLDKVLESKSSGGSVISRAGSSGSSVKPSAVVDKQEEEEKVKEAPPIEGRRVCPKCSGKDFNEQEDKTKKPLHQMGGIKIYPKKVTCKSCGYVFPN